MVCRPSHALRSASFLVISLLVALTALTASIAAAAGILAWVRGTPFASPENLYSGVVCGLIAWLFVGVFHLRKETMQLRVSDCVVFQQRMQKILQDLGFEWLHMSPRLWRTRPGFRALALGSGVIMHLDGQTATLTGPRLTLDNIRRRYRVASQLDRASLHDTRPRSPECYLKRVELSVRLDQAQLENFQTRVLDPLGHGSEVRLEVQLLVSNEHGLRESVWSQQVRPWLEAQGIEYQFHKDHPQRITPVVTHVPDSADSLIDTCVWS